MICFNLDEYVEFLGKYWMPSSTHYILQNLNYDFEVDQMYIYKDQDYEQQILKKVPMTWEADNIICINLKITHNIFPKIPVYIIYCLKINSKQQFFDLALKTLKLKAFQ